MSGVLVREKMCIHLSKYIRFMALEERELKWKKISCHVCIFRVLIKFSLIFLKRSQFLKHCTPTKPLQVVES